MTETKEFPVLLVLLIATDLVFIALHIVFLRTAWLSSTNFSIAMDRGFGEIFGFIKEFWISLLFAYLAVRKRTLFYLFLSLLFFYLLLDDSLTIHERCGLRLSEFLDLPAVFGHLGRDAGECVFFALIGPSFLIPVFCAYSKSPRDLKWDARPLFPMIFALAFFGVFMDMIHAMMDTPPWEIILGVVEEGGEMLVLSVITWFVMTLAEGSAASRHGPPEGG